MAETAVTNAAMEGPNRVLVAGAGGAGKRALIDGVWHWCQSQRSICVLLTLLPRLLLLL